MKTLGLEGTAHTLGIGVIDGKEVLADVKSIYQPKAGSGLHPRDSAQHMSENMGETLRKGLDEAGVSWDEIELVSFSRGPGMGPCLRTVATAARALALYHKKPLLGVNHCVAHIEVGRILSGMDEPLVLYVSGANTQILMKNQGRYRIFGETLDVGIGNMLDKFGRETGLAHPAGPKIEELARNGKEYIELPYVVKGTYLSFSGILTSALQKLDKGAGLEDVCMSLQETAFAMLCEVTERAIAHVKAKEVLLVGGVGNNSRLTEMLNLVAEEHGGRFYTPKGFNGDNGAMIAFLGQSMHEAGVRQKIEDTSVDANWRTDQVEITW